jgi:hypothetical protein
MKEPFWVSFKLLSQHLQEVAEWNYKPLVRTAGRDYKMWSECETVVLINLLTDSDLLPGASARLGGGHRQLIYRLL